MNTLKETSGVGEHFQVNKETGSISVSQRKCAELLGVDESSIRKYLSRKPVKSAQENHDNEQLKEETLKLVRTPITEEIFFTMVEYYAFESKAKNEIALTLYKQIAKAGTRAYLYAQAGYNMQVVESPKVPQTYNEAIKALANSIIETEKLELVITEQAPKVAVYERICASKNTFGVRDVANFYDMRQTDLINLLIERKWIYRYASGNNLRAGSSAKETGLVVQKMNVRFAHSPNYLGTQVRITTKGIVRIAKVLGIVRDDEFFTKMESEFSL